VNNHIPSIEVLFDSVARIKSKKVIAVMLPGMGEDGVKAMKVLHDQGVHTIAQDQKTSVVWGMPGAAVDLEAACEILPLEDISTHLERYISKNTTND